MAAAQVRIDTGVFPAGVQPGEIGTVVIGNVVQAGAKMNLGRQAAIHAGLPVSVPGMIVNRVCGSGAQAIVSASLEIASGALETAVAGGMENMDLAPYLIARARWGYRMGDAQIYDSVLRDGLNDAFSEKHSGWHAEDLAEKFQVTCEAQDRWSVRLQELFSAAQAEGKFESEIVPEDIVNIEGGAIAHGHPIGATGAIITTRLIHSMPRDGLRRGVATLCTAVAIDTYQ